MLPKHRRTGGGGRARSLVPPSLIKPKKTVSADLKTQASFVFLPQKLCGNSAGVSRKNFVNLMGLPTFYLDS